MTDVLAMLAVAAGQARAREIRVEGVRHLTVELILREEGVEVAAREKRRDGRVSCVRLVSWRELSSALFPDAVMHEAIKVAADGVARS